MWVIAFFVGLQGSGQAQDWKDVYDPLVVRSLYLQVDPTDWNRVVNDQPQEGQPELQERADALFNGEGGTPILVEIRRKGATDPVLTSGGLTKVSLKIDINALVPGQRWNGLRKLSLEIGGSGGPLEEGFAWQAHRMAAEAGYYRYDSSNAAWVKLYVNGVFHGVFTSTEQRDEQFLRNRDLYSASNTWLYKVDGGTSLDAGIGDSPTFLHLDFAPFQGNGGGPGPDLDIDLPQWIDMDSMLTLGACNAYLENGDGLFKRNGKNSFAVDFDPPDQRLRRYYPWDLDAAIKQGNENIYGNFFRNEIIDDPWFQRVYEHILRELIEAPLSQSSLHAFLNDLELVLAPELASDPFISAGPGTFTSLRNWVVARNANVLGQLALPFVARPAFNQVGGEVVSGFGLTMSAPAGQIYFTLDGSDPRNPGGGVAPGAQLYTTPVPIDRTRRVLARALEGTNWSGLATEATFNIANYATALRVTEIMYNPRDDDPADTIDNDAYEFIELCNTGATALDVSDYFFDGISYMFPAGTMIPAGDYVVLVRDAVAFAARYPSVTIDGIYFLKLSNRGEKVRLRNSAGTTVISVEYDDDPPWVISPDGLGYSLVNVQPDEDPDLATSWRASTNIHGSPGSADPAAPYGRGVVFNEVLAHTDPPFEDAIELFNAGDSPVDIGGWFLSDDGRDALGNLDPILLKKYAIPVGTVLAPGAFIVLYENAFNAAGSSSPFALTEFGERVYLSSADAAGNLTGLVLPFDFGATENGVSFGRVNTSVGYDIAPLASPSFGVSAPANLSDFRTGGGAPNTAAKVGPVVISEIMYNPPPSLTEFVELHNISPAAVDLSGWDVDGISGFVFPPTTRIEADDFVLLVDTAKITVEDFRAQRGVPAHVPVFGALFDLGNAGEALWLEKPNPDSLGSDILVERVRYNDKSPWPTEADGGGPSLERFVLDGYGNEPLHWRTTTAGGSPGRHGEFVFGLAVTSESRWKFHALGSMPAVDWDEPDYNDSSWPSGDGPLGYGEPFIRSVVPFGIDPSDKFVTTYLRKTFVINDDPSSLTQLTLSTLYDDGFVAYLNGKEVARKGLPAGGVSYGTLADETEAGAYEEIDLLPLRSCLNVGSNVLAVEVHQASPGSADLVWDAQLAYSTELPEEDTDGDGMPDAYEVANGLNPDDPSDANLDSDGDGFTNAHEHMAGTDPQDPSSFLDLIDLVDLGGAGRRLHWSSVPGKSYRVLYTPDLTSWFTFGSSGDVTAGSAISEFTDPSWPSPIRRFYRIDIVTQ